MLDYLSTDIKQKKKLLLREAQMGSSDCQQSIECYLLQLRFTARLIAVQLTELQKNRNNTILERETEGAINCEREA